MADGAGNLIQQVQEQTQNLAQQIQEQMLNRVPGVSTVTHSARSRDSSRTTAPSSKNCSTSSPNPSQAEGNGAGRGPPRDRVFGGRGPYHRQRRSRGKSGIEREKRRGERVGFGGARYGSHNASRQYRGAPL